MSGIIVWVDGTFGVGKTATVKALQGLLSHEDIVDCSSDEFYAETTRGDSDVALYGYPPQKNVCFMILFEKRIKSLSQKHAIVLVDMSLVGGMPDHDPIQRLKSQGYRIYHFILNASSDIVKRRIQNDDGRDQQFSLNWVNSQDTLLSKYRSDYIIDTDKLSSEETAREIKRIVFE